MWRRGYIGGGGPEHAWRGEMLVVVFVSVWEGRYWWWLVIVSPLSYGHCVMCMQESEHEW